MTYRRQGRGEPAPRPVGSRECPVETCSALIAPHNLMCLGHWFMVPADLQAAVRRTYVRGQESNLRLVTDEYRLARINAIDHVNARLLALAAEREIEAAKNPELPLWPE